MTTTELIELLKSVEHGSSGRSREISFFVRKQSGDICLSEPSIRINSTGDGCAGAQLCINLKTEDENDTRQI